MKYFINIHKDNDNFICTEALPQTEGLAIIIDFLVEHKNDVTKPLTITVTPESFYEGGEK